MSVEARTETTLAGVCSSVDYGYTASACEDPRVGPKFLRITDIVPESLVWDNVPHCEIEPKRHAQFMLDDGDIVVARTGATVGYAKQIWAAPSGVTFASYLVRFRPDPKRVDARFLGMLVQSTEFKRWVQSMAGGSAQPNANAKVLGSFPLRLPSVGQQRAISGALWAFDDLIENNRRRIEILEETARLLYREWFVHFRYPGHEGVDLVDSEVGTVPDRWRPVSLQEVGTVVRGRSYRKSELLQSGGVPFLNLKCIERGGGFRVSGLKRYDGKFSDAQRTYPGDIVVAVTDMTQQRMIVARAARVPNLGESFGVISLDLARVVPGEGTDRDYLYGMFRYSNFADKLKEFANGTNVLHLSPDRIKEHSFGLAPVALQHEYGARVRPLYALADNLTEQNRVLREARDLLLPRLVSGELDVSDLDLDGVLA